MSAYLGLILFLLNGFQTHVSIVPPNLTISVPANQVYLWKWTQEKWLAEPDTELREARDRIERVYLDGADHVEIVERFKKKSLKMPWDRQKLFEWGYAAYLSKKYSYTTQVDKELRKALQTIKPPFSYEFMRMRYLVEDNIFFANDYLTALGERLAQADKSDYAVRLTVTNSIVPSKPGGMKKALIYANELITIDPIRSDAYITTAELYFNIWKIRDVNDSSTAKEAIRWYNEYLSREHRPTRQKTKDYIIQFIGRINKILAELEKSKLKGK